MERENNEINDKKGVKYSKEKKKEREHLKLY